MGTWRGVFSTIHEWNWLGVSADALEKSTGLPVVTVVMRNSFCPSLCRSSQKKRKNRQQTNPFESGGSIPNCFFESKPIFGLTSSHLGGFLNEAFLGFWGFEARKCLPQRYGLRESGGVQLSQGGQRQDPAKAPTNHLGKVTEMARWGWRMMLAKPKKKKELPFCLGNSMGFWWNCCVFLNRIWMGSGVTLPTCCCQMAFENWISFFGALHWP